MKKILLSASVLGVVLVSAQSGIYVASGGNVHVQPQTLVYSQGGLTVAAQDAIVQSDGHVQLDGVYANTGNGSNVSFVYTDAEANVNGAYGQLMIKQDVTSTGVATMMTNVLNAQNDNTAPAMSFPFMNTSFVTALKNSSVATSAASIGVGTRYTNYAWYMDNNDLLIEAAPDTPTERYLSFSLNMGKFTGTPDFSNFTIAGIPFSGATTYSISPSLTEYPNLSTSEAKNKYRETIRKQISDFASATTDSDWGHNLYTFGNPYTQNIDLYTLLNQSGITPAELKAFAVPVGTTVTTSNTVAESSYGKYVAYSCAGASFSSSTCTGSQYVVRPFGTFWFKMNTFTGTKTIKFDDAIKTFSYTGLVIPSGGTNGTQNAARLASRRSSARTVASTEAIEELKLTLASSDENLGEVYLGANPWATEEADADLDIISMTKKAGNNLIALVEENNKGEVNMNGKSLFINGFNQRTYQGKPLPIDLNTVNGNQYTIKGSVRIADNSNLDTGNYFLEDKKTKKIMSVNSDFNYSFIASDDDSNRFVAYYGTTPVDVDEVVDEVTENSMNVAKDASGENYVVFKGMTGKAKVMVYNVLGQLVYADEEVSTNVNYSLSKLPKNSGVYIVKVIDDKGKVISKKIVK